MPISIVYPSTKGTAQKPTKLPRNFIAFGTKDGNQRILGVMVSVDASGKCDNKYRIGGSTLVHTGSNPKHEWAIYFQMPAKIPRKQRFALVVFDTATLPDSIAAQPGLQKSDYIFIKNIQKQIYGTNPRRVREGVRLMSVESPESEGSIPQQNSLAYGYLPTGDTDIDTSDTMLEDTSDATNITGVDWAWTDGNGFWSVYFNAILSGITSVNLIVTYLPSESSDEVTDITVIPHGVGPGG